MTELPIEFFKELTLMTIQKEARWMEYEEDMEDFQLLSFLDQSVLGDLSLFLCGYIPQMNMELAIQVFEEDHRGVFCSIIRDHGNMRIQEFSMADFQADFEMNMLVYAANEQIVERSLEESYRKVVAELVDARSGGSCAGCSGCH